MRTKDTRDLNISKDPTTYRTRNPPPCGAVHQQTAAPFASPNTVPPNTVPPNTIPQTLCHQTLCPQTLCHQTLCTQTLCPQTLSPRTLYHQTLCPQTLCPFKFCDEFSVTLGSSTVPILWVLKRSVREINWLGFFQVIKIRLFRQRILILFLPHAGRNHLQQSDSHRRPQTGSCVKGKGNVYPTTGHEGPELE